MDELHYDYVSELFARYFRPAADTDPPWGEGPVQRMFSLTDAVQDPLEQSRRVAIAWGGTEVPGSRIAMELFVITQHGLIYAAEMSTARRALYFLATPPTLFDPIVDQVESGERPRNTAVVVDSRLGRDLTTARPMDAVLRRILDQHAALRVELPGAAVSVAAAR